MQTPVERVLSKLPDARRDGQGWSARCPAHNDKHASLSVAVGDDGRALLHCHAGCRTEAVCAALGLEMRDLMPLGNGQPSGGKAGRIVAEYDYRDEAGELLYQVVRFEPKTFRQRRPDGRGSCIWDIKGVRQVPFRFSELLAADNDEMSFVTEGEKDCLGLAGLGLVATCNSGGAGKWKPSFAEYFHGRQAVVIADNDSTGRKHAQDVARSLHGVAAGVKVLELSGLPEHGDVSDWLDSGGTRVRLLGSVSKLAFHGE